MFLPTLLGHALITNTADETEDVYDGDMAEVKLARGIYTFRPTGIKRFLMACIHTYVTSADLCCI